MSITSKETLTAEKTLVRMGAAGAILGAVVSVAAGAGFGNITAGASSETVLGIIASRPAGFWPAVSLGFIVGAMLWLAAFAAVTRTLRHGVALALGWLGFAAALVGVTVHVIDASINGVALARVAAAWQSAGEAEQARLITSGETLLSILEGTWASVISLFHGLPFVLYGLAALISPRYPAWLGWLGIVGGAGSLLAGLLMFFGANLLPDGLFILFALLVSIWMVAVGVQLWRQSREIS